MYSFNSAQMLLLPERGKVQNELSQKVQHFRSLARL